MTICYLAQGQLDPDLTRYEDATIRPQIRELIASLRTLAPQIDRAQIEADQAIPAELFGKLHDLKLFALTIPEQYEGLGASMYEFAQVMAVLSELDAALVVTAVPHLGNGVKSVLLFATEQQKQDAFLGLSEARRLISFAITEDHTGSDVASHKTRVTQDEQGELHLNGSKTWITNAVYAKHLTIVAKSPQLSPIPDGSTFLMVKPEDEGFTLSKPWHKMGISGSPTVDLFFDDVKLSPDRIIGRPGYAMDQFSYVVFSGRIGAAAGGYGLARRALNLLRETAPPSARREELLQQGYYRLFLMRAGIELASFLNDKQSSDLSAATALCKTYCTTHMVDIIETLYAQFIAQGIPKEMTLLMNEYTVFRVFEGPNEVLNYRAGIETITSMRRTLQGLTRFVEILVPELAHLDARLQAVVNDFTAFLQEKGKTRMLMLQQNLLARVSEYTMHVFTLVGALLKVHTFEKQVPETRQDWTREQAINHASHYLAEVEVHAERIRRLDHYSPENEVTACIKAESL